MARHDPPLRTREIQALYRRVERARLRPSMWATWADEHVWLPPNQALVVMAVPVATVAMLASPQAWALPATLAGVVAWLGGALALRWWVRRHRLEPAQAVRLQRLMGAISNDPRLMALVERWVSDNGVGVLSHVQVKALERTHQRVGELRAWESRQREVHEILEAQAGVISRLRARDAERALDGALPVAEEDRTAKSRL